MIYKITSAGVGLLMQAGLVQQSGIVRIRFDGGRVSTIDVNGKKYPSDRYGVVTILARDLLPKNKAKAYLSRGEKEILLEDFAYDEREGVISPAWDREMVALWEFASSMRDAIKGLREKVNALEKAIEPADNDLCI